MIPRLYFVTHEHPERSHADLAYAACRGGVQWIQLRVKDLPIEKVKVVALETLAICESFGVKLILNDSVFLAQEIGAHGVHLGQEDMDITAARKILGEASIIGGTANTWDDILQVHKAGADYIGLGPFRHTFTKEKLSPILGVSGYADLMQKCMANGIHLPVFAIGGIVKADIQPILQTGIYGVAVASAIGNAEHPEVATCEFLETIDTLHLNTFSRIHGRTYN